MSNFKEIYPQTNFREDLHRMDSLGEDDYEVWAYNGDPDFAPLSSDYSYELIKNTKTILGRDITITDGINMPIESFKLYGESSQLQTVGKNLYRNSDTYEGNGNAGWTVGGSIDRVEIKGNSYSIKTTGAWGGPGVNLKKLYEEGKIQVGDVLTYSVYFKTNFIPSGTVPFSFTLYRGQTSGGLAVKQYQYNEIVPGTWYRLSSTFTVTDYSITSERARIEANYYDKSDQYYFGNNRTNYIWFAQPQVEKGSVLTDYEEYTGGLPSPRIDYIVPFNTIGAWNPSTNYYEIKCKVDKNINLVTNSSTVKLVSSGPVSGTRSIAWDLDNNFNIENYAGKQMTLSFDCSSENAAANSESGQHRYGMEFSFLKLNGGSTQYSGKWFWLPDSPQIHTRASLTFTVPSDWNGNTGQRHFYIQRLSAGEIYMARPKLEPGNKATPYIPHVSESSYKEDEGIIYSPQPLSSLQNGVRDYYDDGWLYLSTIYDIFRATDNWEVERALTNNNVLVVSLYRPNAIKSSTNIWCTHFRANEDLSEPNRIKIDNQRIYISLDKTTYPDLDTLLRWMRDNTVTVCYQRKNILKVASLPSVLLNTYDEITNITNDQNAEMEIEYRIAPNARIWKRLEDGTFIELTS